MATDRATEMEKKSVKEMLGNGRVANILLYEQPMISATVLLTVAIIYYFVELSGMSMIRALANLVCFSTLAVFLYAQTGKFLKRSELPILKLKIKEESAVKAAEILASAYNDLITSADETINNRDPVLVAQVALASYLVGLVGKFFHFWTLMFMAVLILFTLPKLYEIYRDEADQAFGVGYEKAMEFYKIAEKFINENVIQKLKEVIKNAANKGSKASVNGTADAKKAE